MTTTLPAAYEESFSAVPAPIKMVRFSPSGRFMATGDTELQVKIWDGDQLVAAIDPHSHDEKIRPTENIRGLEFSVDEKLLFVAASDTVNAYSCETSELIWYHRPPRFFGFLIVSPQALAVSPNGTLAASFDYGSIATFTPGGEVQWRKSENYAPRRIAFSPKGKALVGVDAFNLCVWNAENGERVHRWRLENKVFTMAASLTEPLIVTRELHTLTIYDIDQFQRICQLPSGRGLPCLAMSPVDRLLASGEKTRIRLINLECQGVRDIDVSESSVLSLAFSADGKRIVAGCADGQVRSWDV
ncbi:MAG TPA: hypothetical protein VJ835_05070 [Fimbriimonadaceae bacterium]|nr:hypothetical protein [Fimbriimonadaceae bacterium]